MLRKLLAAAAFALLGVAAVPSHAQQAIAINSCGSPPNTLDTGSAHVLYMDTTGVLCTSSGGGGGSSTPFTPNGNFQTLTATASSSASTAMPAGATVAFQNTSAIDVSCVLSASSATATTNKIVVRAGSTVFVAVGSNVNTACINQTGSASNVVVLAGGTGLGTNFGGSSSGGGGGGAITAAASSYSAGAFVAGTAIDGWDLTQGTKADGPCASGATACSLNARLAHIENLGASAIPTVQSGGTASPAALISCDNHVFKHITTATDTLAVQGVTSKSIYICGWRSRAAGTATWYLENTASTNANCSSTLTQITGLASEVVNSGDVTYNPIWGGLKNTSGNGLCINSTGTGGVDIDIWFAQF